MATLAEPVAPQQAVRDAGLTGGFVPSMHWHTLDDLKYIEGPGPFENIGGIAVRILLIALHQEAAGIATGICTWCLRMAIGEHPCPHGAFPHDHRARPFLVQSEGLPYFEPISMGMYPTHIPMTTPCSAPYNPTTEMQAYSYGYSCCGYEAPAQCDVRPDASSTESRASASIVRTPSTSGSADGVRSGTPTGLSITSTTTEPARPQYVTRIDPFDPEAPIWYVVLVGRTVGVFSSLAPYQAAIHRVPGAVHFACFTHQGAVSRFRQAEAKGDVEVRG